MKRPNPMRSPGGLKPISNPVRTCCSVLVLMGSVVLSSTSAIAQPLAIAQPSATNQVSGHKQASVSTQDSGNKQDSANPQHQSSSINYPPGLCYRGERDISGTWVNDGTGQLVPLTTLCEVAIQHQEIMTTASAEIPFWQAFVTAASPEALEFANEAGVDDVVAYGQTICPSLHELGSMDELRIFQAQGGLPASFDAAVNVAAIHTYCPEKTRSIGR